MPEVREYEKVWESMRKYEKVWESMRKCEKVCKELRKCVKTWESVPNQMVYQRMFNSTITNPDILFITKSKEISSNSIVSHQMLILIIARLNCEMPNYKNCFQL